MDWLTEDAKLVCAHEAGSVQIVATQKLVSIDSRLVLVEPDPESRTIDRCPWSQPGFLPCTLTLKATGYSPNIRIDGQPVALDSVVGVTNGTPATTFRYYVRRAGQSLVSER